MIIIGFAIIGIGLGLMNARRRNGTRLDMAQYAAGFGIAFTILGFALTVVIERLAT
ncbi:MAG: apolipoprotein acyltransferase [Pseudomonadota bacterium]